MLINKLNTNLVKVSGEERTRHALNQAKEALIGYAVIFPETDAKTGTDPIEGPGYLPCPDITNNGTAGGSCSLSTTSTTSIGRLPYITLEIQDIRDGHGERLWYIVSNNFRNNPKNEPLNSETAGDTSGSLTVNGIPDIAAIILAPGVPQDNQNRNTGPNDYSNYLEITVSADAKSITISNTDNYILLTRDELMNTVEKRVLGEVKTMLTSYYGTYNAYPLLATFADPKAEFRNLRGTHNGSNNSANPSDSTVNFIEWDIQSGDTVINITDGSVGAVTNATMNTLTIGGLTLGTENDFDVDDEYAVIKTNWSTNILSGTAGGGSSNLTLVDSTMDFKEIGISAGNIVENLSDINGTAWSKGIIESVGTSTELTIGSLSGGTNNQFSSGDSYLIRSNVGQVTGPDNSSVLIDVNKDFVAIGIQTGDMVINLSDSSLGRVSAVASNTLTLDDLNFGTDNDFDNNDFYYLPRYNTDNVTRKGLLSFHDEGKLFSTAFDVDFNISASSSDIVFDTTNFPGVQSAYITAVETYISNYVNSNTTAFDRDEGACNWVVPEIAECYGTFEDYVAISGIDTASSNSQTQITDSSAQFIADGVKRGDLVHNFDDETFVTSGTADTDSSGTTLIDTTADFTVYEPFNYVIQNDTLEAELGETKIQGIISEIVDATTLVALNYVGEGSEPIEFRPGDVYRIYEPRKDMVVTAATSPTTVSISGLSAASPDFDAGEYYRIIPAAKASIGRVDSTAPAVCTVSTTCTINDADGDFRSKGIKVGDTIENTSDSPQSFGEITAVTATTVTVTLYGGTQNLFTAGNNYTIYHDYVHLRQHEIRTRFSGNVQPHDSSATGIRKRNVCLGYSTDCNTIATPATFTGNGGIALLTTRDFELDGTTEVGRATFIPSSSSTGALRVANIEYYLAESAGDIPEWFLNNKWHQLVYIAYSADYVPGGGGNCVASGNCLTLTGAGAPDNNKQAIAVISGKQLATQDRASADIDDYYESQNASTADDIFQHESTSAAYNDQAKIIE